MSLKYTADTNTYCYHKSNVLVNKLHITDNDTLEKAELEITSCRASEVEFSPPPYDMQYWKNIHKSLFYELYEWAGKVRNIGMTKGKTQFCNPRFIEQEADKLFQTLMKNNYCVESSHEQLIITGAELYAELNMLHPFREGNGRSQRILFEHIFAYCGYQIHWDNTTKDNWIKANIAGAKCNYTLLEDIFKASLSPI